MYFSKIYIKTESMGRVYLDYLEDSSLNIRCRNCDSHLTHLNNLKHLDIETVEGKCSTFTILINYIRDNEYTFGQFHKSDYMYIYDVDCPIESVYSGLCCTIKCKMCMTNIGWIHTQNNVSQYLLLKEKFC